MATVVFGSVDHILRGQIVIEGVIGFCLRDFPVLAEFAVQVATGRGNGKRERGREHVEEGLLLDGINMNGTGIAINKGIVLPIHVLSNSAVTTLSFFHLTYAGTELALDPSVT